MFSGEGEVALSMTEFLLRQLGATPEQIDRETGTDPVRPLPGLSSPGHRARGSGFARDHRGRPGELRRARYREVC